MQKKYIVAAASVMGLWAIIGLAACGKKADAPVPAPIAVEQPVAVEPEVKPVPAQRPELKPAPKKPVFAKPNKHVAQAIPQAKTQEYFLGIEALPLK